MYRHEKGEWPGEVPAEDRQEPAASDASGGPRQAEGGEAPYPHETPEAGGQPAPHGVPGQGPAYPYGQTGGPAYPADAHTWQPSHPPSGPRAGVYAPYGRRQSRSSRGMRGGIAGWRTDGSPSPLDPAVLCLKRSYLLAFSSTRVYTMNINNESQFS